MYWYIEPESKMYHTDRDCPRLNSPYWGIGTSERPPVGRRLCGDCEWRTKLREQVIKMLAFKLTQRTPKVKLLSRMHCSSKVATRILDGLVEDGFVNVNADGTLSLTTAGNLWRNELTNTGGQDG
jgi:predicted transcriptional regulator